MISNDLQYATSIQPHAYQKLNKHTCLAIPKSASLTMPPLSTRMLAPFISLHNMTEKVLVFDNKKRQTQQQEQRFFAFK